MEVPAPPRLLDPQQSVFSPAVVREVVCFIATRPGSTTIRIMLELWGNDRAVRLGGDHSRGLSRMLETLVGFGVLEAEDIEVAGDAARIYSLHATFPKTAIRKAIDLDMPLWHALQVA